MVAEQGSIVLGRDAETPVKGGADRGGSAESCQAADALDRFGSDLQQLTGVVDACIGEPCHRRHSGLFAKPTGERSPGHVCVPGERVEVEREGHVLQHPVAKRGQLVAARLGAKSFDELRLPSLSLWRSDQRGARPLAAAARHEQMVS